MVFVCDDKTVAPLEDELDKDEPEELLELKEYAGIKLCTKVMIKIE